MTFDANRIRSSSCWFLITRQPAVTGVALTNVAADAALRIPSVKTNSFGHGYCPLPFGALLLNGEIMNDYDFFGRGVEDRAAQLPVGGARR